MSILLSHPTGNRNVRALMEALHNNEIISKFNTTISVNKNSSLLKFLPNAIGEELKRRTFPIDFDKIRTYPFLEYMRLLLPRLGLRYLTRHEKGWACVDSVYKSFDKHVADQLKRSFDVNIKAVYSYEDGAYSTFVAAKSRGLKCIYDLPIAYWETGRRLMQEESERLPNWASTLGGGISDSEEKLERKSQELKLADVIVCPSQFVVNSIPKWANNKTIILSPFGSPSPLKMVDYSQKEDNSNKPLRILFVGSMGQRKGLGDLFTALRLVGSKNFELVAMGSLQAPMDFYKKELSDFTYEGGRPHRQVLELMRTCDLLCLPSIVEGRALVMQEAMSQGLPLIITPNTGGEDLIIEGQTGFLVPIRSPEMIAQKLTWFIENRRQIPEMSRMAQQHAETYTWNNYGKNIIKGLQNLPI